MERNAGPKIRGHFIQRNLLSFTLILCTLAIGIVLGTMVSRDAGAARKSAVAPDATPLKLPPAVEVENEFSRIAKQSRGWVVHIKIEMHPKKTEAGTRRGQSPTDEMFRRFFGMPGSPMEGGPHSRQRRGEGSGVIVDENGYIITNHHVIENADRIRVRLFDNGDDRTFYDATLIGFDPETDLAVLKIDAGRKLKAATIGNSDAVNVGDWAIAVGSPFGYQETVTVGIISAKSREMDGRGIAANPFQRFLQTDAAINPGNSGGPLLNIRGEVIGINTAIVSRSGGSEGLGFSLPSRTAVEVYNQIIQYGRMRRGSIGIEFRKTDSEALVRTYGAKYGVFVTRIREGGPADKAGMKSEDVIVEIDGAPIRSGDELIAKVASLAVGKVVPIVVQREEQRKTLQVEIADRSVLFGKELGYNTVEEAEPEAAQVMFGIEAAEFTAAQREEAGFEGSDGVLVSLVEPASFADDIGMFKDDVIVAINRKPVASVSDIHEIQSKLKPGDDIAVKVMRRRPARNGKFTWETAYLAGVLPAEGK